MTHRHTLCALELYIDRGTRLKPHLEGRASEDKMCQTDRQAQRKVASELHKHHYFAMISSADGDQRLTATAFSAFICKAQSQSLFSSSSSCRFRFKV